MRLHSALVLVLLLTAGCSDKPDKGFEDLSQISENKSLADEKALVQMGERVFRSLQKKDVKAEKSDKGWALTVAYTHGEDTKLNVGDDSEKAALEKRKQYLKEYAAMWVRPLGYHARNRSLDSLTIVVRIPVIGPDGKSFDKPVLGLRISKAALDGIDWASGNLGQIHNQIAAKFEVAFDRFGELKLKKKSKPGKQ